MKAFICLLSLVLMISMAYAQEKGGGKSSKTEEKAVTTQSKTKPLQGKMPQRIVEMDTLEVWGKVQKPHVWYVIDRGELKMKELPMERNMVRELQETVKASPF